MTSCKRKVCNILFVSPEQKSVYVLKTASIQRVQRIMRASSKQICTMIVLRGPGHTAHTTSHWTNRNTVQPARCKVPPHESTFCFDVLKNGTFWQNNKTLVQYSHTMLENTAHECAFESHIYIGGWDAIYVVWSPIFALIFSTLTAGAQPNVLKRRYMASAMVCQTQPK